MNLGTARRYGQWAGFPEGVAEDLQCCIEHLHPAQGYPGGRQCNRKRGHGPGGEFCARHNPEAVNAKRAKREADYQARRTEQDAIVREAEALAKRLGVDGQAYYESLRRPYGYRRVITISFADAATLADRLSEGDTSEGRS